MINWLSWIWLRLKPLQHPLIWVMSSKFTIGVCAIITNEQGQIWLQQHRFWPQQSWGLPGGHLNYGESLEAGLSRELQEETGRRITQLHLKHAQLSWTRGLVLYYAAKFEPGKTSLDNTEVIAADFFAIHELPNPMLPAHKDLLVTLLAKENSHEGKHKKN